MAGFPECTTASQPSIPRLGHVGGEPSEGSGGGVIGVLLAPARLPGRALETLGSLATAARDVGTIRSELTRVREQTEPLAATAQHIAHQTDDLLPVAEQLSTQAQPLAEVIPALERIEERLTTRLDAVHEIAAALAGEDSHLNKGVRDLGRTVETRFDALQELVAELKDNESGLNERVVELGDKLVAMHETVTGLKGDVERITDRLPDPSRGPLEKARDALTGANSDTGGA